MTRHGPPSSLSFGQVSPACSFSDLVNMVLCDAVSRGQLIDRRSVVVQSSNLMDLSLGESCPTVPLPLVPRSVQQLIRHVLFAGGPSEMQAVPAQGMTAGVRGIQARLRHGAIECFAGEDMYRVISPINPYLAVRRDAPAIIGANRLVRPGFTGGSHGHQVAAEVSNRLTILSSPGERVAAMILSALIMGGAPTALERNHRCGAAGNRALRSRLGHVVLHRRFGHGPGAVRRSRPVHLPYVTGPS